MARILLIDDETPLLRVMTACLQGHGHEIATASDGRSGLQQALSGRFDIVITDIIMPEMEGLETIIQLRAHRPDVRIIAMSGGGRIHAQDYLKMAGKLGAHATLAKPFDQNTLFAAVNNILRDVPD